MDRLSIVTLGAAKAYTNASIAGGGAIKGKNCQIKSSTPITGGTRIVFAWYLDSGVEQTTTVDVMDGVDGAKGDTGNGVKSASIVENHLILTLDDDTTVDAGLLTNLDTTFEHIDDISLNNLADGQILKYNATTGKWENASAGTVDTSLVDLNDVDIDNLTDGQIIVWDATARRWKNANNSPSITVDPTPTQGSGNAVASGGVYTALQGKADSSDVPTKTSELTNDSNFVADASYVHTDNNYTTAEKTIVGGITAALADKVDKVSGKGLSTNDYSNADKAIVDGVTSALAGKADIADVPTKISDLTNDSDFVEKSSTAGLLKNDGTVDTTSYATSSSVSAITDGQSIDSFSDVETALAGKADTSDLPSVATSQEVGLSKPDGTTITIDGNGVLTAVGGGSTPYDGRKTRYTISSSNWSSSPNSDGYYTYSLTLNPVLNTSFAPNVYIAGSGDSVQPTATELAQYSYLKRCNHTASNTLVLYADTKPTSTFYVYVEGNAAI